MTRAELLAALERERICGDPALLMQERHAPQVAERIAGYYTPAVPEITKEQAARNRWLLSIIPDHYNNGDPEVAAC